MIKQCEIQQCYQKAKKESAIKESQMCVNSGGLYTVRVEQELQVSLILLQNSLVCAGTAKLFKVKAPGFRRKCNDMISTRLSNRLYCKKINRCFVATLSSAFDFFAS